MTVQEFYDVLKAHDWSFNYSDDHRHWTRGRDQMEHIKHILKNNSGMKVVLQLPHDETRPNLAP